MSASDTALFADDAAPSGNDSGRWENGKPALGSAKRTQAVVNVLVADHHPIVVMALSDILRTEGARVRSVTNGNALLDVLEHRRPDILIVEPEMSGRIRSVNLVQTVIARWPKMKVAVYSGRAQSCLISAAIDVGAHAWVAKTSSPMRMIDAVRVLRSGGRFIDPAVDLEAARAHPWQQLTAAERDVVLRIARGESLPAIAHDSGRSYKTVSTHKYNALGKLGLRSASELGRYVGWIGLDYLLD